DSCFPARLPIASRDIPSARHCSRNSFCMAENYLKGCRQTNAQTEGLDAARRALGVGDSLDQGGAFAAEGGAALVVAALAGGGDLVLEAALVEEEEVELHRFVGGGLLAGHDHQFGDQAGELAVVVREV